MKIRSLFCCLLAVAALSGKAHAEYAINTLDLNDAHGLIEKGMKAAETNKIAVCFAVVDHSGNLIAFERMDHAPYSCVEAAIAKARTAALYRVKTSLDMQLVNGNEPAIAALPNMMPIGGGVPVVNNSIVVGAVGVSGASNQMEIKVAEAMVAGYAPVPEH